MSDDGFDLTIPPGLEAYPADQSLYRAILNHDQLKKNNAEVKHSLFYRYGKDVSGVSVDTAPEACRANFQQPIFGLIDITAGQIREVVRYDGEHLDAVPSTTTHGNMKKVPYRDEDQIESTRIAKELARRAHVYEHYRVINSPNVQTSSAIPASIAGVTLRLECTLQKL
jgi:hypothetical protein